MPTFSNLLSGTLALLSAQLGKIPGDFQTSVFCKAWNFNRESCDRGRSA